MIQFFDIVAAMRQHKPVTFPLIADIIANSPSNRNVTGYVTGIRMDPMNGSGKCWLVTIVSGITPKEYFWRED